MSRRITVEVPLNRVEGDLEVRAQVDDGVVTDAWCSGTTYRGFERILLGRGALDGLVITPRVCGICSTSHLRAAVQAIEDVGGITPPPNAVRLRDVAANVEHLQSDIRHAFLMFAPDFTNPRYEKSPLFAEAVRRYQPLKGESVIEVIRATKHLLEVIAILGGQWPHSTYMVPGGLTSMPTGSDLLQCLLLVRQGRSFFERRVLGCSIERFAAVSSEDELEEWLAESDAHRDSELGFFLRFSRDIGLHEMGSGPKNFLSFGSPDATASAGGFTRGDHFESLDETRISEHVSHSWFVDYDGGRHPHQGETIPYATGREGKAYSWAKAPRYDDLPTETGPLAQLLQAKHPLISDLVRQRGTSAFTRQLARLIRPVLLIATIERLLGEVEPDGQLYVPSKNLEDGEGCGLVDATRGALGHWVRIENGVIAHYQIITPTAWNASPRDSHGQRGPMEEALVGTRVADPQNPVELGHVVRSFDACLVCTVHTVTRRSSDPRGRLRI